MNTKQEKIYKKANLLLKYSIFLGGVTMFILPIVFKFFSVTRWKANFWLIVLLSFFTLLMTLSLLLSLILTRNELKKITSGPKKLQNLSPKKARILRNVLGIIAMIIFGGAVYIFLPYSIKGIDYLYIQNKEPITQTDLVIDAKAGRGTSKFTVQNVEFGSFGKLEMWFTGSRFKKNQYYEITIIPDTKYILDRRLVDERE